VIVFVISDFFFYSYFQNSPMLNDVLCGSLQLGFWSTQFVLDHYPFLHRVLFFKSKSSKGGHLEMGSK